ncbi:16S rRNA (cytosine(967)-C(5))-methyltransferase RsmB [Legionella dresdenensis]|uniref:16S rRNA (cytosine(967)-C(5))-methyltransferase n=1 Tax=Legionella dresdenensis TaxID=450200 RepID=A0ABV8CF31_9GAMM
MKKNERLQAVRLLHKVIVENMPLMHALQGSDEVTPLAKAICFGVCRHYYRLQAIAGKLVDKRPQMDVWLVLLAGLYQMQYMSMPDYAVVKETVGLLDKLKKSWAKGLVNAVLRRFGRESSDILQQLNELPDYQTGHPDWFVRQMQQDWPQHWQQILQNNDEHPPMTLRVNLARVTRQAYLQQLNAAGIAAHALVFSSAGIALETACDVNDLPGFKDGLVSVQDEAAQLVTFLLDLKPGLRVLDACCAPGGKTCHILESETELQACVALDIESKRLQRVQENLARLKLTATIKQGDALKPESWWDGNLFDRILLDAPCSATGVIRRHPDIKLLRTPEEIGQVVLLQEQMLDSLWTLLKPGGRMVYATCSVIKQENEQQIARFIARQPDCRIVKDAPFQHGIATGHGWQILPGQSDCDGFFYSILQKG